MDAWKLYKEEVAGRIAEGPWAGMISGFLMTMQDFIPEFFETLDQDPGLQAMIVQRMETAVANYHRCNEIGVAKGEEGGANATQEEPR